MRRSLLTASALSLSLLFTSYSAFAQESSNTSDRLRKLEQEINLLKRQQEVGEEVSKSNAEKQAKVEFGKKGLSISSPDKNFALKLRGYAQLDQRFFLSDETNKGRNDFIARRIRPILEGTLYKDFSWRFMSDFAGSSLKVYDAYLDYKYADPLQFRVGKFKPPLGLERLQSASDIEFVERGHPTNLVPTRDFGFQIFGDAIPETVEYQLGIFSGTPDLGNNDTDADDKKDYAGRVFTTPFSHSDTIALQGLGFGIAGSVGEREGSATNTILGDYRTPGQLSFFKYRTGTAAADNTFARGTHRRINPEAYYYYGPLGLLGEYVVSSQEVQRGTSRATLDNKAWEAQASYVLTGEDASFKGVKPSQEFNPEKGGWGAFEVVARIGETDIDDAAFPIFADITASASKATSIGTGLNWYLNENVKLVTDYDRTSFERGAAGTADRDDEHALFTRAQFKF